MNTCLSRRSFWATAGSGAALMLATLTSTVSADLIQNAVDLTALSRACCDPIGSQNLVIDSKPIMNQFPDSNELFETFVTIFGEPFPGRTSPPAPFASAAVSPDTRVGVGVSGIVFNQRNTLTAQVTSDRSFTNVGSGVAIVDVAYMIPAMQLSVLPGGPGIGGPFAALTARATFEVFRADGVLESQGEHFNYDMSLEKLLVCAPLVPCVDIFDFNVSPDVDRDFGQPWLSPTGCRFLFPGGAHRATRPRSRS
jgi:hypothetical protein